MDSTRSIRRTGGIHSRDNEVPGVPEVWRFLRGSVILDAGDVVLRPYEDRDRGALIAILSQSDLMQLVLDERAFTRAEAETFIDTHFQPSDRLGYETVSLQSTHEAI